MNIQLLDILQQAMGELSGGRVLDVATGEGGFAKLLAENLKDHAQTEIIGVDSSASAVEAAHDTLRQEEIRFIQMDAERLGYADWSIDTVSLSASVHHLADVPQSLEEIKRVLKPGGHLVLAEMHRDGQTAAHRTAVHLHH